MTFTKAVGRKMFSIVNFPKSPQYYKLLYSYRWNGFAKAGKNQMRLKCQHALFDSPSSYTVNKSNEIIKLPFIEELSGGRDISLFLVFGLFAVHPSI